MSSMATLPEPLGDLSEQGPYPSIEAAGNIPDQEIGYDLGAGRGIIEKYLAEADGKSEGEVGPLPPLPTSSKAQIIPCAPVNDNAMCQCHYCKIVLPSNKLVKHIAEKHNKKMSSKQRKAKKKNRRLKCSHCESPFFPSLFKYRKHMHKFHPEEELEPMWVKSVKKPEDEAKAHKCLKCGDKFVTPEELATHEQIHLKKKVAYCCPHCGKLQRNENVVHLHIRRQHTDKMFKCPECLMLFLTEDLRKAHMEIHVSLNCPMCPAKFQLKDFLTLHLSKMHPEPKFSCLKCGRKFMAERSLASHTAASHSDEIKA